MNYFIQEEPRNIYREPPTQYQMHTEILSLRNRASYLENRVAHMADQMKDLEEIKHSYNGIKGVFWIVCNVLLTLSIGLLWTKLFTG